MAKVIGAAGEHAGKQSVAAFRRMLGSLLGLVAVVAFGEGVMLSGLITLHGRWPWYLVMVFGALLMLWIARLANRRVEKHESERMSWRKGALGEYAVGAELERLPDDYFVFNGVNTEEFGDFDHIVVGPKGVFAIETKNWTGVIGADAAGELTRNGHASSSPHIQRFERKLMMLRDQILVLTRRDDLFVRGIFVFPSAYLESAMKTRNVHCMKIERVYNYFDELPKRLLPADIDKISRAVNGVADMNPDLQQKMPARAAANEPTPAAWSASRSHVSQTQI